MKISDSLINILAKSFYKNENAVTKESITKLDNSRNTDVFIYKDTIYNSDSTSYENSVFYSSANGEMQKNYDEETVSDSSENYLVSDSFTSSLGISDTGKVTFRVHSSSYVIDPADLKLTCGLAGNIKLVSNNYSGLDDNDWVTLRIGECKKTASEVTLEQLAKAHTGGKFDVKLDTGKEVTKTVTETNDISQGLDFSSAGKVLTEDGREIAFDVKVSMSQKFCDTFSITSDTKIIYDPLVINMGKDLTEMSDKHFYFDIDSDGKADVLSLLKEGSGYLAYDKNGDGIINDGSELFGTKSGDGFADLASYDTDGNGWIDENDDIFGKLAVWLKDDSGKDTLVSLKDAGVGAIFTGSAKTEYNAGEDAVIRRAGIYLNEDGTAGTVSHIDYSV